MVSVLSHSLSMWICSSFWSLQPLGDLALESPSQLLGRGSETSKNALALIFVQGDWLVAVYQSSIGLYLWEELA